MITGTGVVGPEGADRGGKRERRGGSADLQTAAYCTEVATELLTSAAVAAAVAYVAHIRPTTRLSAAVSKNAWRIG